MPLFVVDEGLRFAVPNRARFLRESLADLRDSLRRRGGDLVLRRGDPVEEALRLAAEVDADGLVLAGDVSAYAGLPAGGESAARGRMNRWLSNGLAAYANRHDDLPGDATSRLSADLHFGCLSPLELAVRAGKAGGEGGEAYVRQLCWRDFHAQVTAAFPALPYKDCRPRRAGWREGANALDAWKNGRTSCPIVDAGMRQLAAEGFMHNRARLLVASFLTKRLNVHWTEGARHFFDPLVDGDIANNSGNWQWVAGTGNDTRPNRQFNMLRQAQRFDPDGDYVRRYVPELAAVEGGAAHAPWKLDRFDLTDGEPVRVLDPYDIGLCRDVSGEFEPATIGF